MAFIVKGAVGISLLGALLVSVIGTGCSAELDPADVDEEGAEITDVVESPVVDGTLDGCGGECRRYNCVGYARCRTRNDSVGGPILPPTGDGWGGKLAVARSATGRRGCVAMIRGGTDFGHAAYVEDSWLRSGARHYRLSEASWEFSERCSSRSGTKAGLKIVEFWCP